MQCFVSSYCDIIKMWIYFALWLYISQSQFVSLLFLPNSFYHSLIIYFAMWHVSYLCLIIATYVNVVTWKIVTIIVARHFYIFHFSIYISQCYFVSDYCDFISQNDTILHCDLISQLFVISDNCDFNSNCDFIVIVKCSPRCDVFLIAKWLCFVF